MLATLRNRRGIINSVEPYQSSDGIVHLVNVEYVDDDGEMEDQIIWEIEPGAKLLYPAALPNITGDDPMSSNEFDAMVRATRWSAISPYIDPDGPEGILSKFPISAPLHGAIQPEDFQMMPLLKAMQMPRISLLIADDVGLGKTIEAGLIISELIIRRRIRKMLVITPASLKNQWCEEMYQKFSIHLDIVDRDTTSDLKRKMGLDANPWRTYQKIVASYHYLKQPDILEQFCAASRRRDDSPHLPWDLLIVDEAHNLAPAPIGEQSDLTKMLSAISPLFEHKIFLTATPHNGHTRSFTGLLEKLDPVRFHQTSELKGAAERRVRDVLVRRLKKEINQKSSVQRFCERALTGLKVNLHSDEKLLSDAFRDFRSKIRMLVAQFSGSERLAGTFAVEILGKRLLSSPYTFADSWHRYLDGMRSNDVTDASDVNAARKSVIDDLDDDLEAESRMQFAAVTVGSWLKPFSGSIDAEVRNVNFALEQCHLNGSGIAEPVHDCRYDALLGFVNIHLRNGKSWVADERLIVFTEYKTTLDYLQNRLKAEFNDEKAILILYGGMDSSEREEIKRSFNDPDDPVRILIATDAASEGLNLQETARFLLHYDVPWNPSRLEQRNGRLDRHGQPRDVIIHYFESDDDADLRFLSHVVRKVNTIREDLGSIGDLFDTAFERKFIDGMDDNQVIKFLDDSIKNTVNTTDLPRDQRLSISEKIEGSETTDEKKELERLDALKSELDFSPQALKDTLEIAMSIGHGLPRLTEDSKDHFILTQPVPGEWEMIVDETLRNNTPAAKGALRSLVFNPDIFIRFVGNRPVFRPELHSTLMHLAHPVMHKTLASFSRLRFPGADSFQKATRWKVTKGEIPDNATALLLLTIEEIAVNELRETFHHWVKTVRIPVINGELGKTLEHIPASDLNKSIAGDGDTEKARDIWEEIEGDVKDFVVKRANDLTEQVLKELSDDFLVAKKTEQERFLSRQGEISEYINQISISKIEKEIEDLKIRQQQMNLFFDSGTDKSLQRLLEDKEQELNRRKYHYEELREQLELERVRILDHYLPKRFALHGRKVNCFPVAVEIRLPGGAR